MFENIMLVLILAFCGWIMITLNEIDKTNTKQQQELWKKIDNMQNQQDGINYKVDGLYEHLVVIKDREDIDAYKKELEERYKDDGES